ncbi:uncharacterized protein I206_102827 [Kwoniella pini CBS 10737]|uniref:Uncharacterized protein n=1 Tax=Kwoniella pini CBS 10737 TaxID=1296096 RepID=A0A1B9I6F0_9TREE|nr:uncharacterized protein I206_03181 [Kwoniella pini CBS 10737]OCF51115.1 hypothetical protein I206_03181 [Kwoniella pini CBS 10737]
MSTQPSTSTPTAIPGASLPSSSKPKRNKKKSANKPSVKTPSVVEESPVPIAVATPEEAAPSTNENKEKGPVEEVIAKRQRQLIKKLQRFRGYAAQPHESLNADQRAAVASLPAMEGVYKELDDLIKQIEPVELEQAGRIREVKEQAEQEVQISIAKRISEFQSSLSTPLSLFLRLHQLLHPARSTDHEHLTFARLELPSKLQDEVQATDVLRVGRMYEDLISGGERGSEVIAGLIRGPTGEDEENDHVHHLLTLLTGSDSEQIDKVTPEEIETEDAPTVEVQEPASKASSENSLPNGDVKQEVESVQANGQGALNFLQEDELVEEDIDIPSLAADQTSGSHPPQEPITTVPPPPIDATPAPSDVDTSNPAPTSFAPSTFDWAADEDLDEAEEAAHIRQAFALPPSGAQTPAIAPSQPEAQGKVEEQNVLTEEQEPAIALIQDNELANAHVSESVVNTATGVNSTGVPVPPAVESTAAPTQRQGKAQRGQGRGKGGKNGSGAGRNPQNQKAPVKPSVDEDGFQVVGRQAPQQTNNRGRGNGIQRGRGDGRGRGGQGQGNRGQGGTGGRGGARVSSTSRLTGEGQPGGNKQPKQQQQRQPSHNQTQNKNPAPSPTAV